MSLSSENKALVERVTPLVLTASDIDDADLNRLLDAAREEGRREFAGGLAAYEPEDYAAGRVIYHDAQEVEGRGWILVYAKLSKELP